VAHSHHHESERAHRHKGHAHDGHAHDGTHDHHYDGANNGNRSTSPFPEKHSCPCGQHNNTPLITVNVTLDAEPIENSHLVASFPIADTSNIANLVQAQLGSPSDFSDANGHSFPYMNCRDILRAIQSLRC
jgi:hypothetical protein